MILRCHGCQAALKFDEEKLKGRRTARCPRCQTILDLPDAPSGGASSRGGREADQVIACGSCGARLKAPAGALAARSRCPRCGSAVSLGAGSPNPAAPPRAASGEGEENSSAATRRIDSRAIGMSMPVSAPAMPPPPALSFDPSQSPNAAAPDPPGEPAPAVSLTRPPVGPLRDAAMDIQAAARSMSATVEKPSIAPAGPATDAAPKPAPPRTEPAPSRTEPAPPSKETKPRPASRPDAHAFTPYPLGRGAVAGLGAGLAVGGTLWGSVGWIQSQGLGWLIAPLFSWMAPTISEPVWRLALLAAAGGLSGLIAAGAGSPGRLDGPLSIVRCAGSALLPGVLLGMLAVLVPAHAPDGQILWPAVSWMRDLLLVGLLTPAVNRILPGQR